MVSNALVGLIVGFVLARVAIYLSPIGRELRGLRRECDERKRVSKELDEIVRMQQARRESGFWNRGKETCDA